MNGEAVVLMGNYLVATADYMTASLNRSDPDSLASIWADNIRRLIPVQEPKRDAMGFVQRGIASWYGPGFHGRPTASGEIYDQWKMTAAHLDLPFGSKVRVVCEQTGNSVVVVINDRGPYIKGRIIDLSAGAAKALGLLRHGIGPVSIEVLGMP